MMDALDALTQDDDARARSGMRCYAVDWES